MIFVFVAQPAKIEESKVADASNPSPNDQNIFAAAVKGEAEFSFRHESIFR